MPSQTLTLTAAGLYRGQNPLSAMPEGALLVAENAVLQPDGVIQPRRGLDALTTTFGSSGDRATAMTAYLAQVFARTSANKLVGTSGGSFTDYTGSAVVGVPSGASRNRFEEAGGALFLTSSTGVLKLDGLSSTLTSAGQLKATSMGFVSLTNTAALNWLPDNSAVAYRYMISKTDNQGRLIRGTASGRLVVTNSAGASRYPTVEVLLPQGISTEHTIQLFRSAATASASDEPSDEVNLVYEVKPSSAEVAARTMNIADVVPDNLRGAALYTNATQEGIAQANEPPPLAQDICLFRDCLFLANTTGKHRQILELLSVGGTLGVAVGDRIVIGGNSFVAAAAVNTALNEFAVVTSGSPSQNIRQTAESLVYVINKSLNVVGIYAYYLSTPDERPGKMLIEERTIGGSAFAFAASAHATAWNPIAPTSKLINSASLVRAGSTVTATTTTTHGFTIGQSVNLSAAVPNAAFPVGVKVVVSTPTASSFTYTEAGSAGSSSVAYDAAPITELSEAERGKNRVYVSKAGEYEAFPIGNWLPVGDGQEISRVVPLRDSVMVFKPDGVFRITGDAGAFGVSLLDPTVAILAPDTAAPIANQVMAWTNQGVVMASDAGVQVISPPVDLDLQLQALPSNKVANVALAWGIGYETERLYLLWTPAANGDLEAQRVWVYSLAARGWTRWGIPTKHGVVEPSTDRLWLAYSGSAGMFSAPNTLQRERKERTVFDYIDQKVKSVTLTSASGASVVVSSSSGVSIGQILYRSNGSLSVASEITNIVGNTLTVADSGLNWGSPGGALDIHVAIDFRVDYAPVVGEGPSSRKQFREVQLLLGDSAFSDVKLVARSDVQQSEAPHTVPGPGRIFETADSFFETTQKTLRIGVRRQAQRATQLWLSLQKKIGFERLVVRGIAVVFNAGSTRTRK